MDSPIAPMSGHDDNMLRLMDVRHEKVCEVDRQRNLPSQWQSVLGTAPQLDPERKLGVIIGDGGTHQFVSIAPELETHLMRRQANTFGAINALTEIVDQH